MDKDKFEEILELEQMLEKKMEKIVSAVIPKYTMPRSMLYWLFGGVFGLFGLMLPFVVSTASHLAEISYAIKEHTRQMEDIKDELKEHDDLEKEYWKKD